MKFLKNKQNIFLLLLILMAVMGAVFPFRKEYNAVFPLEKIIDWGIAGIFFLYGLKLNLKEIIKDIFNWKLHLLVQTSNFVLFPCLVLLFYGLAKDTAYYPTWLSVFFLASLPSTVSSSVVMVSIARGNVPSAIFNASISGLLGIVMTPLLMGFFLHTSGEISQSEIIYQLFLKVVFPIVLGLILHPIFKNFITKYSHWVSEFDKMIILLIVYESFSNAFLQNIFNSVPVEVFFILLLSVIGLFFSVYYILKYITKQLNFSQKDTITTTFCGSKKSLIHGSLFVMVLGISEEQKVLFLLPVMLYHSFQLFYVSWLAGKIGRKS